MECYFGRFPCVHSEMKGWVACGAVTQQFRNISVTETKQSCCVADSTACIIIGGVMCMCVHPIYMYLV